MPIATVRNGNADNNLTVANGMAKALRRRSSIMRSRR